MLDWCRARKAGDLAVAAIKPYLAYSGSRIGQGSVKGFHPYVVGFLGMLITLVARHRYPSIGTRAVGHVQSRAWAELTQTGADLIGQEISFLSANEDADFQAGCMSAQTFFDEVLRVELDRCGLEDVRTVAPVQSDRLSLETQALERWVALFECGF